MHECQNFLGINFSVFHHNPCFRVKNEKEYYNKCYNNSCQVILSVNKFLIVNRKYIKLLVKYILSFLITSNYNNQINYNDKIETTHKPPRKRSS